MKVYSRILAFSLLFISLQGFSFESYDYTPMDDNEYASDDNYDNSYQQLSYRSARNYNEDYYQPTARKKYSKSEPGFTGAGKAFVFDPKNLRWYAFYNGQLVNSGRASGGRHYCSDIRRPCKTPAGVFRIGHKGGPDCKSSKYPIGKGNAPMPWCMFFRGGFAIHGSWSVPNYNASHGCIRVPPSDARWLNTRFLSPGSKVVVKSY